MKASHRSSVRAEEDDASPALDIRLLQPIVRRDASALQELYERHSEFVYRYASMQADFPDAAAAAVEDLFLEVWRSPADLQLASGSVRLGLAQLPTFGSIEKRSVALSRLLSSYRRAAEVLDISEGAVLAHINGAVGASRMKRI